MSPQYALAQLRHLYAQMLGGHVHDTKEAARGLLGPAIEALEPLVTPTRASPPMGGQDKSDR